MFGPNRQGFVKNNVYLFIFRFINVKKNMGCSSWPSVMQMNEFLYMTAVTVNKFLQYGRHLGSGSSTRLQVMSTLLHQFYFKVGMAFLILLLYQKRWEALGLDVCSLCTWNSTTSILACLYVVPCPMRRFIAPFLLRDRVISDRRWVEILVFKYFIILLVVALPALGGRGFPIIWKAAPG